MKTSPGDILLVEDDLLYAGLMLEALHGFGYDTLHTCSLAQALEACRTHYYDACLLDLGLPDSFGLQTFQTFFDATPELPVVIVSSLDDERIADQAVQLGAQDYLVKGPALFDSGSGSGVLARALRYAMERQSIQRVLLDERRLLEERVTSRTAELRALARRLVSAQEDERRRISRELHDEAGQALTALSLNLSMTLQELPLELGGARARLLESIRLADSTMEMLRCLAHDLRPPALEEVGLNQTLKDFCRRVQRSSQLRIQYRGCLTPDLPGHIQVSLYRTLQEGLTNVIRHAHATRVLVQLSVDEREITLVIRDNGIGIEVWPTSRASHLGGIGLMGIQERIQALGGRMGIRSKLQAGTTLSVSIPLVEDEWSVS